MTVTKHDTYYLLQDDYKDTKSFGQYLMRVVPERYEGKNLVVDLGVYSDITLGHLLHFLEVSNHHRGAKNSFVFVCDTIDVDEIPLEMVVVPTLQEAGDIIEMEEIERDLGF
ncbi:MAG: ribonuclease Z [Gilvibacter sp.]